MTEGMSPVNIEHLEKILELAGDTRAPCDTRLRLVVNALEAVVYYEKSVNADPRLKE